MHTPREPVQIRCLFLLNNFNAKKNHRSLRIVTIVFSLPEARNEPYRGGMALANSLRPTQSLTHSHVLFLSMTAKDLLRGERRLIIPSQTTAVMNGTGTILRGRASLSLHRIYLYFALLYSEIFLNGTNYSDKGHVFCFIPRWFFSISNSLGNKLKLNKEKQKHIRSLSFFFFFCSTCTYGKLSCAGEKPEPGNIPLKTLIVPFHLHPFIFLSFCHNDVNCRSLKSNQKMNRWFCNVEGISKI